MKRPISLIFRLLPFLVLMVLAALIQFADYSQAQSTNQPPVALPDSYSVHGSLLVPNPGALANDTDPDGDQLTVTYSQPTYTPLGSGNVFGNGSVYFSANGGVLSGTVSIPYTVADNRGGFASSTVTFNIHNAPPVAAIDIYEVTGISFASRPDEGLSANDFDPDGDTPLQVGYLGLTDLPDGAGVYSISPNAGGRISGARSAGFTGTVVISYSVADTLGAASVGYVVLVMKPMDGANNAGASCPIVAEPVNVTNGNMWLEQSDYVLPGIGENIAVNRFYNTVVQQTGLFGFGWTTQYDESITAYGDKMLRVNGPDGRADYFVRTNSNGPFNSVRSDVQGQVVKNPDNTSTLTFKDGRIHNFSPTGRLVWQKDRNGNQTTLGYDVNGTLTTITDAVGRTLTFTRYTDQLVIGDSTGLVATYDYFPGTSLLKTVTYPDGSKYKFEYDSTTSPGKILLKTVKDALDNILETHAYDSSGRATTSEKQGGIEKYEFNYSNAAAATPYTLVKHKKNLSDPYIETKYYFDNSRGRNVVTKTEGLCSCSGGGSEVTEFFYDIKLNLTKKIDALGRETNYTYNSSGDLLTAEDKIGSTSLGTDTFTYNSFGEILTHTDRMGGVWTNTFDSAGNLKTSKDPLNNVTTIEYPATNNKGLPDSIKDARNNITKFKWFPASGLLEEIEDPYTKKTKFTYDTRGRTKTVTNPLNHVTQYNYFDDTQRKVEMIYPNSDKITYKYDIRRLLENVTDERGKITAYEFDPAYRLKKIIDPLGHVKEFGYDLMSNMTSYKDPLGNITDYVPDDFNRIKEIIHPAAVSGGTRLSEKFEYDKLGRIKKYTDTTTTRFTQYGYDDSTRTNTVTDAAGKITTTKYNQRFQTIEVKDALNQVYTFGYDPMGRVLSQTRAGDTISFEYDEAGNRKKRTDYAGRITNYTHDNLNRLTKIEYDGGANNPTPKLKSTYGYDDISRLTSAVNEAGTVSFNYDNRGRVINTTDVFGHLIEYEYERTPTVNQRRLKLDSAMYALYNVDDAGRLVNIVNSSDSTTTTFGYDNEDKITSSVFPNGVTTTYDYYDNDLLKRLKDVSTTATLFDRQYTYNAANQIAGIADLTNTRTFSYDNADRLLGATATSGPTETYAFDDVGNRTSSHLSSTYGYQTGKFNQLASTVTATMQYDANGNMTSKSEGSNLWRYGWDNENRLIQASTRKQAVRYKYDALGRRVERNLGSGQESTKFVNDGQDVLLDDNSGTLTKYLNGPGIDNKLRAQTGSSVNYFLTDHLGSTNGLADSTGAITSQTAYDSFGNQTGTLATRYGFTGRERDDFSGLMHYRAVLS